MFIQDAALSAPPPAEDLYPPRLRVLLAGLSSAIRGAAPGAQVRVTYAPFQHIDAFMEIAPPDSGAPARLDHLLEPAFRLAEREGYTVAILVRATPGPSGRGPGARCRW